MEKFLINAHRSTIGTKDQTNIIDRLVDKSYKRRKAAAVELQMVIQENMSDPNQLKIVEAIHMLKEDLVNASAANARKGGLMALSATAIALAESPATLALYLNRIVLCVLPSFLDPDCTVRFAACEALYNIAKVSRSLMLPFFTRVFDILSKLVSDWDKRCREASTLIDRLFKDIITEQDADMDLSEFVDLFSKRIFARNAKVSSFLVSWLVVLDSVPGIDFLPYLPQFLRGMLQILDDPDEQIQDMTETVLNEIFSKDKDVHDFDLRLLLPTCISFLKTKAKSDRARKMALGIISTVSIMDKHATLEFAADILDVVFQTRSVYQDRQLREIAVSINQTLLRKVDYKAFEISGRLTQTTEPITKTDSKTKSGLTIGSVPMDDSRQGESVEKTKASFDLPAVLQVLSKHLNKLDSVPTRTAVLRWFLELHMSMPISLYQHKTVIISVLLRTAASSQDGVATLALECLAEMSSYSGSKDNQVELGYREEFFNALIHDLLVLFRKQPELLEEAGSFIIANLGQLTGPVLLCHALSEALSNLEDPIYAESVAQHLGQVILTTPEFSPVRDKLFAMADESDRQLFVTMYRGWSCSAISPLAFCLLAEAHGHATTLLSRIADLEVTLEMNNEVKLLASVVESASFSRLRIQLLDSRKNTYLIKALFGLLMLLPQNEQQQHLRGRLKSLVGVAVMLNKQKLHEPNIPTCRFDGIDFEELLEHYDNKQNLKTVTSRALKKSSLHVY
eukprot:m.147529 g.147529  ORF g.147529 m.147529 type:complete len:738 (-) comp30541_c0_seq2:505-2718(-)